VKEESRFAAAGCRFDASRLPVRPLRGLQRGGRPAAFRSSIEGIKRGRTAEPLQPPRSGRTGSGEAANLHTHSTRTVN
jgi:hypothetical protein